VETTFEERMKEYQATRNALYAAADETEQLGHILELQRAARKLRHSKCDREERAHQQQMAENAT
jgi:hypothetical protein